MAKRTASAKKQARASVRRTQRNRAVRSEVKTRIVKARQTLLEGPVAESDRHAITLDAIRALDRAAAKGILHRGNAARRKARLTRQLVKVAGLPLPGAAAAAAAGGRSKKSAAPAGAKGAPAATAKAPDKKAKK